MTTGSGLFVLPMTGGGGIFQVDFLENKRVGFYIISKGFQMAEAMNDISSLPVPVTKFEGDLSYYLRQLFVISELIANKIKNMKDINHPELMGYHQNCFRKL